MKNTENYCNGCPDCICCKLKYDIVVDRCSSCEQILEDKCYEFGDTDIMCYDCSRQYIVDNVDDFMKEYEKMCGIDE